MSEKEKEDNENEESKNTIEKFESNEIEGNINNEEIKEKLKNKINLPENKEEENKEEEEINSKENENKIIEEENQIKTISNEESNINIEKEKESKEKEETKEDKNKNKIIEENKNIATDRNYSVDIMTKQFKAHNDDDKYLVQLDEDKELENIINEHNNNSSDEDDDEEEEETFPFRIIGDIQKKGETLGKFNHRYLEIDSVKGIIKRYKSSKEYPRYPLEIIPIKTLKSLKKCAKELNKDCYDLEIIFTVTKGNKKEDKSQIYRVRHSDSRNKWHDIILALWKHLVKGDKIPKIDNHKLLFVDDQAGIVQDIKQHNDRITLFLKNIYIM